MNDIRDEDSRKVEARVYTFRAAIQCLILFCVLTSIGFVFCLELKLTDFIIPFDMDGTSILLFRGAGTAELFKILSTLSKSQVSYLRKKAFDSPNITNQDIMRVKGLILYKMASQSLFAEDNNSTMAQPAPFPFSKEMPLPALNTEIGNKKSNSVSNDDRAATSAQPAPFKSRKIGLNPMPKMDDKQNKKPSNIFDSNVSTSERPAPFPLSAEMFLPAPPTDAEKLVYITLSKNDHVVLFATGLNTSDVKTCFSRNEEAKVISFESNGKTDDCCVVMITCARPKSWKEGDIISVGKDRHSVIRSIAAYHPGLVAASSVGPKYFLCGMAMMKNVARFIVDWVRYHRRMGVDHFYIFDNNSSDMHELPSELPDVEFIPWPWKRSQRAAYTYGSAILESRCRWVVYNDVDEYLWPKRNSTFADAVRSVDKSNVAAIQVKSMTMTAPELRVCNNGTVPERYLYRQAEEIMWERNPKTVARPGMVVRLHRIHTVLVNRSRPVVIIDLPNEAAHIVHYKYPCWPDYYSIKVKSGRAASTVVWYAKGMPTLDKPAQNVLDIPRALKFDILDTSFRDYKLAIDSREIRLPVLLW